MSLAGDCNDDVDDDTDDDGVEEGTDGVDGWEDAAVEVGVGCDREVSDVVLSLERVTYCVDVAEVVSECSGGVEKDSGDGIESGLDCIIDGAGGCCCDKPDGDGVGSEKALCTVVPGLDGPCSSGPASTFPNELSFLSSSDDLRHIGDTDL